MESNDPIILLETYHSTIEANLAKSKLDAFGIPCFLTQENLTVMVSPVHFGGVRLYIFENDLARAAETLQKELQKVGEEDVLTCPNCRSKRILDLSRDGFDPSKVVKFILQLSKTHYCVDCEAEFDH